MPRGRNTDAALRLLRATGSSGRPSRTNRHRRLCFIPLRDPRTWQPTSTPTRQIVCGQSGREFTSLISTKETQAAEFQVARCSSNFSRQPRHRLKGLQCQTSPDPPFHAATLSSRNRSLLGGCNCSRVRDDTCVARWRLLGVNCQYLLEKEYSGG